MNSEWKPGGKVLKKRMKRMISVVLAASLCFVEPGLAQAAESQAQQEIAEPGNLAGEMQEAGNLSGQFGSVEEAGNPAGQP